MTDHPFNTMHVPERGVAADSRDIQPLNWMDQNEASRFLLSYGIKLSSKSLQKRRVVGGSPPFRKIIGRIVYEVEPLRAWAEDQLSRSPRVCSTSEFS